MPVDFLHLHFIVGERRLRRRVPVHQAFAAIEQTVLEEAEEGFPHRAGARFIHGERLAVEIAGAAHGHELLGDAPLVFVFPRLDFFDEILARKIGAAFALFREDALLDHGLRGDAGVVSAGHPDGVVARHPPPADKNVLQRVVQRMPQVQGRGDVGRRDDDRVRLARIARLRVEESLLHPHPLGLRLDGFVVVRFGKFAAHGIARSR